MTVPTVWHARTAEDVARDLGTDPATGLAADEAAARLAREGPNALPEPERRSFTRLLFHQFKSLIVVLLLVAAGVSLALGDRVESAAILIVIAINAAIGFATEWRAAAALEALRRQAVPRARVRRDGAEAQVDAHRLVRGDLLLLAAGDRVSADARVVDANRLQVDESALTGESVPVEKSADAVPDERAAVGDRASMVHMGTVVTDGRGAAVVVATGAGSEIGRIDTMLSEAADRGAPLEAKLARLSRTLVVVVIGLCALVVGSGWLRGNDLLPMVEVGISLAIAAVPEGLLAVTTMTLAIGMQRMARMNALVRRLAAVETLGSTTVIASDKTGTLTRNEMTVRTTWVADPRDEERALRIGALCNDATHELGDPTEVALVRAAERAGVDVEALRAEWPREAEVPFDSGTKRMVTLHRRPDGRREALAKGAPSAILAASSGFRDAQGARRSMTDAERDRLRGVNDDLADDGLRVLALAHRESPDGAAESEDTLGHDLTFVGYVGMQDPLRDGVVETIATCRAAGIRTLMLTGDQVATAAAIARELGMDRGPDGERLAVVHERELRDLDDVGWDAVVRKAAVFARVSPEHKLRIVEALQRQGEVVAMTGDGVNDAPALKAADIGVAMGIRGTEVAKEAADMIITDDDFTTIVGAVEQGRVIVNNVLRFIHYLFSCNLAEIVAVFAAIMLGWPLPFAVMQILWLNMITDIFPALALALEPSAPGVMRQAPRDAAAPLLTPAFGWLITWQGMLLAACTLIAFRVALGADAGLAGDAAPRHATTVAFMTLALAQVAHAYNCRSTRRSAFGGDALANRWLLAAVATCVALQLAAVHAPLLQRVLRTTPLSAADWGLVGLAALAPVAIVESVKSVLRSRGPGDNVGGSTEVPPTRTNRHET